MISHQEAMERAVDSAAQTPSESAAWVRIAREVREASAPGADIGALMGDVAATLSSLRASLIALRDPEIKEQLWQNAFDQIRDHVAAAVQPGGRPGR